MATVFFNWRGPQGRETVDQLDRQEFAADRDGFRAFRAEARRLVSEYHLAGMAVYQSSRPCKGWL